MHGEYGFESGGQRYGPDGSRDVRSRPDAYSEQQGPDRERGHAGWDERWREPRGRFGPYGAHGSWPSEGYGPWQTQHENDRWQPRGERRSREPSPYDLPVYGYGSTERTGGGGNAWDDRTGSQAREVGGFRGRGPRGYQRSTDRIREDVCERLSDHPEVDATEVEVDVQDGVVVLRGTVDDRWQKRAAEDAAAQVSGIRDVRNELEPRKGMWETLKDAVTGQKDEATEREETTTKGPRSRVGSTSRSR